METSDQDYRLTRSNLHTRAQQSPPFVIPTSKCSVDGAMNGRRVCQKRSGRKESREGVGLADQTGDTGSAARRVSPRKNPGRNEREGESAGAAGSSGVDSRAGVGPVALTGVTWTEVVNG